MNIKCRTFKIKDKGWGSYIIADTELLPCGIIRESRIESLRDARLNKRLYQDKNYNEMV